MTPPRPYLDTLAAAAAAPTLSDAALAALVAPLADAAELTATPQDPLYHAEGDVWIHTRMAVAALRGGPAWRELDPLGRIVTLAAVLSHDLGKRSTTRLEADGRWSSRGHSARGEIDLRVTLWRLGVPWTVREHICQLVRWHQVPLFGVDRPDAVALAIRLSTVLRHDWLTAVATADAAGRRCARADDQARLLDQCALWRLHCDELGVGSAPYRFPDDYTRARWLAETEPRRPPELPYHDDSVGDAVVVAGLPCSGKSTYLASRPELAQVSLDDLRAELEVDPADGQRAVIGLARDRARAALRAGQPFAWNATNLSRSVRGEIITLCRAYRFRVHLVYCEAGADELAARNRARPEATRVPARALERMYTRWTVPTPDEAHRVLYRVSPADDGGAAWPPAP
ncbi:MAG: AAA family ATPase [Kofleriaceae bacterium]|jgi:predicted kinase|nr:AAA family ATPase [Kofleriaceae bacterium]MBP9169067.1 AAA family ATPase [Kofleriaceae bacterium]MBP9858756.1 AAA family ATPase [Kofleriaceae bacterium]